MSTAELSLVNEEKRELNHMKNSRLDDSLFSKDLAPHYMQLASKLASSSLVPKAFQGKPQDLFICWAMGYQIGISPEQSMQCIAVINGRPAMWGDDMLALCMAHKEFDDIIEEPMVSKEGAVIGYTCTVKRKGKADKVNVFTLDMAKKAGLLAKGGVWTQYPERMLKLRARGFTLRDAFPDALKGIKSREEVEDYIDADYKVISDAPKSRTEFLKMDIQNKNGTIHHDANNEPCESNESFANLSHTPQTEKNHEPEEMGKPGDEKTLLHFKINELIHEKQFSEERLTKALLYYEVACIDEMDEASCEHFINTLMKL